MKDLPPNDTPEARAKRRAQRFYVGQSVSVWIPHEERYVPGFVVMADRDLQGRIKLKTPHSKQTIHVLAVHILP